MNAAEASADSQDQANQYAKAIALYRGPLLSCFYQECFTDVQRQFAELYYRAMIALPLRYETAGDRASAFAAARAALSIAPLAEEIHCCLMRLYAASGQPSAVLRQYQEMESILQEELGEKPSQATRELMESLRESGRTVLAAVSPVTAGGKEEAMLQEVTGNDPLLMGSILAADENEDRPLLKTLGAARRSRSKPGWRSLIVMMAAVLILAMLVLRLRSQPAAETSKPPVKTKKAGHVAALSIPLNLPKPNIAWMRVIPLKSGDKSSEPTGIALDPEGNIIVTGFVDTKKTDVDYLIQKLSSSGDLLWQDRYNGTGNDVDWARAVAIDRKGNIFVSGESDNGKGQGKRKFKGLDVVTLKDSPDGKRLFTTRWNGSDDGEDRLAGFQLDLSGSAYLAVNSYRRDRVGGPERSQIACLKYDADSKGDARPVYAIPCPANGYQETIATDMISDGYGAVYIAGYAGTGAKEGPDEATVVLKINSQRTLEWKREAGPRATEFHTQRALTRDNFGNIIVSYPTLVEAESELSFDIGTTMFSPGGSILWSRGFSTFTRAEDWPSTMTSTGTTTTVAGQFIPSGGAPHISVVNYDRSGHERWRRQFSAMASGDDYAACAKSWSAAGDIFITGYCSAKVSKGIYKHSLLVMKLQENGQPVWLSRMTPDPKGGAEGKVMVLDSHGGLVVAGQADWKGQKAIVVVRYNP